MIKIGVIGYGYWGPNLVRNLIDIPGCQLLGVCELRPDRLELVHQRYPWLKLTSSWQEIVMDPAIDAVVVATPIATHFPLALEALRSGKHVFVEKPLAGCSDHARTLVDEAASRNLVLMAGHVFVYSPAVRKIHQILRSESFGKVFYYDSVRVNLGAFQRDYNVLWDLAVHDLSILDYLIQERPSAVSATGISHLNCVENTAHLTVFYDSSLLAHIGVNWLAPVKVRQALIGGSRQMIVYDDVEPSDKVKVYDKGVNLNSGISTESVHEILFSYRTGDMWAPKLDTREALNVELDDFVQSIKNGRQPVADGFAGLRVIEMLEASTKSMRERGRPVELSAELVAH